LAFVPVQKDGLCSVDLETKMWKSRRSAEVSKEIVRGEKQRT